MTNKDYEIEIANIKINYIASMIIVIGYIFFKTIIGTIVIKGYVISPELSTIILGFFTVAFFFKEAIIYSKYIAKKIVLNMP